MRKPGAVTSVSDKRCRMHRAQVSLTKRIASWSFMPREWLRGGRRQIRRQLGMPPCLGLTWGDILL